MPQYECRYVKQLRIEGTEAVIRGFVRDLIGFQGRLEDICSWRVSVQPDSYRFSGQVTVSSRDFHSNRREAVRKFLYNEDLPDDLQPGDVTVVELSGHDAQWECADSLYPELTQGAPL